MRQVPRYLKKYIVMLCLRNHQPLGADNLRVSKIFPRHAENIGNKSWRSEFFFEFMYLIQHDDNIEISLYKAYLLFDLKPKRDLFTWHV